MASLKQEMTGSQGFVSRSEITQFCNNIRTNIPEIIDPSRDVMLFHVSLEEGEKVEKACVEICFVSQYHSETGKIFADASGHGRYVTSIENLSVITRDYKGQRTITTIQNLELVLNQMFHRRETEKLKTDADTVAELALILNEPEPKEIRK